MDADGYLQSQITVQFVQRDNQHAEDLGGLSPMGGATVIADGEGHVRYVIAKKLPSADEERMEQLRGLRRIGGEQAHIDQMEPKTLIAESWSGSTCDHSMPEAEAPSMNSLRIRMYNVGFGDCFLLFIPTEDGERTMLLDCGKHMSSKTGHTISEAAKDVVRPSPARARPALTWSSPPIATTTTSAGST